MLNLTISKTKTTYMTYGRRHSVDYIIIMKVWSNLSTRSCGAPVACTTSPRTIQSKFASPKFRKESHLDRELTDD